VGGGEEVPAACSGRKKKGRKEAAATARWPFYRGAAGSRGGGHVVWARSALK
jgi:hypothetical protein